MDWETTSLALFLKLKNQFSKKEQEAIQDFIKLGKRQLGGQK